jgi:hypothetical protein
MDTSPHRESDDADQPDELETADAPVVDANDIPDTTDDDDAPVDNPSGG